MKSLALSILIFGCSIRTMAQADSLHIDPYPADEVLEAAEDSSEILMLLKYAESFHGAKYSFGSCGPKSFDCSGFVMHVYDKAGISLPHTSGGIANMCEDIKLKKVKPGDLLFFSGRKISKKSIGHVSIVKSVQDGKIVMIHATVQSGVISEVLEDSDYFMKRFIRAGRIKNLPK